MAGEAICSPGPWGYRALSHCLGSAPSEEAGAKGDQAVGKFGLNPYRVNGLVQELLSPS